MVEKSGAKLVSEMAGTTKIFGRDDKLAVVFSGKRASSKKGSLFCQIFLRQR